MAMWQGSRGGWRMELEELAGMVMNPFTHEWSLSDDVAVNYIACFKKCCSTGDQAMHDVIR
jgi:2-polyprenyl-3-methyl-5-hydroxy-6-metoxy-1,4-benzoquinol methylase